MVRSTIGNEHIRASYNAGLTVVRRDKGILTRCAELFAASLDAGMRPYRGTGMNIFASTGHVGEDGSEYWGSSQTALTLAIWASTDRVVHYPDHYNVPLHLVAADGDIDPRWLARPPVHLHYHWMFDARHHEIAMELARADAALAGPPGVAAGADAVSRPGRRAPRRHRRGRAQSGGVIGQAAMMPRCRNASTIRSAAASASICAPSIVISAFSGAS